MSLTAEELRRRLHYDPQTGEFTRIKSRIRWVGKPAGAVHKGHGYVVIKIDQVGYLAHRLAWLYVYGEWPKHYLDHKNCIRHDNRIENLREADPLQNAANRQTQYISRSGLKGVTYKPNCPQRPWLAYMKMPGRRMLCLGQYATPEEASEVYLRAAQERYGEFARGK